MGANLNQTLASLRDVDGIVGSFVVNAEGELVAQDLPSYFEGAAQEAASRAIRLRDALSLTEGSVSACTIRYADHKLSLRSVHGALLAVLANSTVNAPALRMAMNLVVKKCSPAELAQVGWTSTPPQVAPVVPEPAPPLAAPVVGTGTWPSIPVPPNTQRTPLAPPVQAQHAPEGGQENHPPLKKERAVFFRGKRVN